MVYELTEDFYASAKDRNGIPEPTKLCRVFIEYIVYQGMIFVS